MSGSLPGPENIHREELENGITVLARANFSSPSVTISGYIRTGSILDPDPKLGLADFTCLSADARDPKAHLRWAVQRPGVCGREPGL